MKVSVNMMINKLVIFLLLSMFVSSVWAECDFDDFPIMDGMKVQLLMADTVYNNRPMTVRSFTTDSNLAVLVGFYHRRWRGEFSDSSFAGWTQVSSLQNDCLMTMQAGEIEGVGTAGRLVMSAVPEVSADAPIGEGVLAPGDAVVVSDMTSDDGPKVGRVTILTSAQSVSSAAQFYTSQMSSNGWWLERRFAQQGGAVLVFREGANESNIAIIPAGEYTQIIVNEVTAK